MGLEVYIKQVRSKDNRYSTVEYDKDGNIILQTKAARKARAKARNEKKKNAVKCSAYTKKKKPCPNLVEESRGGTLCHIHDPGGIFRTQVAEKRKQHMK
jgi:hypothetical protein